MITKELEIKRSKIATKDEEIKRLLKTLNYSNEVKENILETLKESPMDFSLREEILKVFRKKITEENETSLKRKFKKTLKR